MKTIFFVAKEAIKPKKKKIRREFKLRYVCASHFSSLSLASWHLVAGKCALRGKEKRKRRRFERHTHTQRKTGRERGEQRKGGSKTEGSGTKKTEQVKSPMRAAHGGPPSTEHSGKGLGTSLPPKNDWQVFRFSNKFLNSKRFLALLSSDLWQVLEISEFEKSQEFQTAPTD